VVTGGASGIGAAICQRLARDGLAVLAADRDEVGAAAVARTIEGEGGTAAGTRLDVTRPDEVEAAMALAVERFGSLDVLVACAGRGQQKPMLDITLEEWNAILAVNLTGVFLCGQAAAARMVPKGRGRIVNIASMAGLRGIPGRCAYGASKGGVITLTKVMAAELGPHGVTVNAIAPGPVDTPMTREVHTDATRTAYTAAAPLGRYGSLDELAGAASFLCSDDAAYVTGHVLAVDGGITESGPLFQL
jgi:3-oxoacyl-[acyl-carrier protein] reductase